MSSSRNEQLAERRSEALEAAAAIDVTVDDRALAVTFVDGRVLSVPLEWFPRQVHASPAERANAEIEPGGNSIWWPDLDDGIEVAHLLVGWKSGEGAASLQRWLDERAAKKRAPSKKGTRKKAPA